MLDIYCSGHQSGKSFVLTVTIGLYAGKMQIWYLFCEVAAEEIPVLTLANKKSKEWVKAENKDHVNLKVAGWDGFTVQVKIKRQTSLNKLMKVYWEW